MRARKLVATAAMACAAVGAGGGLAAAGQAPSTTNALAPPSCVDYYLGNNGAWKYVKITNNCGNDVRVAALISERGGGTHRGPCFDLQPNETRIDRYSVLNEFIGLTSC